jgi:hypothetical protein
MWSSYLPSQGRALTILLKIILIPDLVAQTCLLVKEALPVAHKTRCVDMTGRSYGTFDHNINGVGFLTGANTLDVALSVCKSCSSLLHSFLESIGIDSSLLTGNLTLMADAYRRIHAEMVIKNAIKSDGIRADGSFGFVDFRWRWTGR